MLEGNIWVILKGTLFVSLIVGLLENSVIDPVTVEYVSEISVFITIPLSVGLYGYLLKFVRDNKPEIEDIIDFAKEK